MITVIIDAYRIVVAPEAMKRITEEYTYEYYGTEEEI